MFSIDAYNYTLPEQLIAQKPVSNRENSKLLFLNRKTGGVSQHVFHELSDLLEPSDVLVVNNTEVIPGRLLGKKDTGGKAEVLIIDYSERCENGSNGNVFSCNSLIKSSKRPKKGASIFFDQGLSAEIIDVKGDIYFIKFTCPDNFEDTLYRVGKVPLPPYIKRKTADERFLSDRTSYQTVYASQKGAIAAPTAGLHFSKKFMEKIKSRGIKIVEITLHVGYGTFLPVRVSDIRDHRMHSETYRVSKASALTLNRAKTKGSRIVAVGTTCVRTLEHASNKKGRIAHGSGKCDLFIYPGYRFKFVDAMITNFHLPRSTLLMLVSAFAGRNPVMNAYEEAIQQGYRFYSYGDAMLIT